MVGNYRNRKKLADALKAASVVHVNHNSDGVVFGDKVAYKRSIVYMQNGRRVPTLVIYADSHDQDYSEQLRGSIDDIVRRICELTGKPLPPQNDVSNQQLENGENE